MRLSDKFRVVTFIFRAAEGWAWLLQHLKTSPRFEKLPHLTSFGGRQGPPPSREAQEEQILTFPASLAERVCVCVS